MLCLLACDELARSPFRSYLKTQMDAINLEYFDFWSCMRRFLQLKRLLAPKCALSTDNAHELELEQQLLLQHIAEDFLPSVEGLFLSPELKERLMDDLKHKGQSSLIFATQDVLSNVLSIPATQFAVHDVITFRGATSSTRVSNKSAEDDKPTLTIKQTIIPPNPWAEYPASKIQGDAEKVRVEFSKFKGIKIVGVLTEQHRLLAFQYLILANEDLRTTSLCTVEDLTMMNWSNYGSLHIPYRTPGCVQPEVPSEISVVEDSFDDIDDIDQLLQTAPDIVWQIDKMELEKPEQLGYGDLMDCVKRPEQYEFFSAFLTCQKQGNALQLQYCRTVYAAGKVTGARRKRLLELIHKKFLNDGGKNLQCLDDSLVEKMSGKTELTLDEAMEVQTAVLNHLGTKWFPRYIDGWPTDEHLTRSREDPNEPWLVTWKRHYSRTVGEEPDQWEKNEDVMSIKEEESAAEDELSHAEDESTSAEDEPKAEPPKKPSGETAKSALMLMIEQSKPDKRSGQSPMALSLARLIRAATDELQRRNVQWLDSTSYFMGRFRPRQRRFAIVVPPLDEDDEETWDLDDLPFEQDKYVEKVKKVSVKKKKPARIKMLQGKGSKKEKLMRFALSTWKLLMALRSVHNVLRKIRDFASSVQDPMENRLFHEYLRREIYNAELQRDAYTTVDWSAHPVYFRKLLTKPPNSPGAKPIPITINKLTADLRFWVDVYKYKQEMAVLSENSTVGLRREPAAKQRALAIARCYLDSEIPPKLQINITNELSSSISTRLKRGGPSVDLFYDAFMRLTPILFHFWKTFDAEWLAKMRQLSGSLAGKRGSWPGTYLDYLDLFPMPEIVERRADILRTKTAAAEVGADQEGYNFTIDTGLKKQEEIERAARAKAEEAARAAQAGDEAKRDSLAGGDLKRNKKTLKDMKVATTAHITANLQTAARFPQHSVAQCDRVIVYVCTTCVRDIQRKKTPFLFFHHAGAKTKTKKGWKPKDRKSQVDIRRGTAEASAAGARGSRVSGAGTEWRKRSTVHGALGRDSKEPLSLMKVMQAEMARAKHPWSGSARASGIRHAQGKKKETRASPRKVHFEEEKGARKTGKPASDKDLGGRRISVTLTAPDPEARGFQLAQDKSKEQHVISQKNMWKNVARDLRVCRIRFLFFE
ncbi:hypothetical protein BaRGS_00006881 [Batillaria attramentaria]|uniref:RGS domain-containing protein n=1 Tax=Batillaria attramentaria TaxID=370345 RepID=A0ABD0LRB4_9CAEN